MMTVRTLAKGKRAKQAIIDELVAEGRITVADTDRVKGLLVPMVMELGSLASVKQFAESFLSENPQLHSLVLNAGIMHTPYGLTADGIEQQFGVNHLAHFYLSKLLTPALQKAQPSTVVSVASNGQFASYKQGVHLTLDEINSKENYNNLLAYGQSKLSNVIFAQELGARFKAAGERIYVNSSESTQHSRSRYFGSYCRSCPTRSSSSPTQQRSHRCMRRCHQTSSISK